MFQVLAILAPPAYAEKFVYVAGGITIADDDGQNQFQVTSDYDDRNPALSADGRTIALDKYDRLDRTRDLYLVDVDGRNRRLLFNDTQGASINAVFLSDKDQLVFDREADRAGEWPDLYRIDLDGRNLTRLTSDRYVEREPTVSPDGNLIVFADSNGPMGNQRLVRMRPDGSERQEVTNDPLYFDSDPSFSPDGGSIVFARNVCPGVCINDIWTVDTDGSNLTRLTTSGPNLYPTWSANGQTIIYQKQSGELWAMNYDGANQRRIAPIIFGLTPSYRQANGMDVTGGDLFQDLDVVFDLEPDGEYEAKVTATDARYGIRRLELGTDSDDGEGFVVKDTVEFPCTPNCPTNPPETTLTLDATEVPNENSDVEVRAVDGFGNAAKKRQRARKNVRVGITEMRLGRTDDPDYPVFGDWRFNDLMPHYIRIFVPWERIQPEPRTDLPESQRYNWNADVGGVGYRATIPEIVNRTFAIRDQLREELSNPDLKIQVLAVFTDTPCWATIPEARRQGVNHCEERDGRFPNNNEASWPDLDRRVGGLTISQHYKKLVAWFAKRFAGPGVPADRRIRYYSAWNEPNFFNEGQPQFCRQQHRFPAQYPRFDEIPCPPGHQPRPPNPTREQYLRALVADDYYYDLYKNLYNAIRRENMPGEGDLFPREIRVLASETGDYIWGRDVHNLTSLEDMFNRALVQKIVSDTPPRPCGRGMAWSKHSHVDLERHSLAGVTHTRRALDGLDPVDEIPFADTSGCTKRKQIWITEASASYNRFDDPTNPAKAPCRLHDFLDGENLRGANRRDLRRIDAYMQYLYQTEPATKAEPDRFDRGLLSGDDLEPPGGDGLLDERPSYDVFRDWSQYQREQRGRPTRADYARFDCRWGDL